MSRPIVDTSAAISSDALRCLCSRTRSTPQPLNPHPSPSPSHPLTLALLLTSPLPSPSPQLRYAPSSHSIVPLSFVVAEHALRAMRGMECAARVVLVPWRQPASMKAPSTSKACAGRRPAASSHHGERALVVRRAVTDASDEPTSLRPSTHPHPHPHLHPHLHPHPHLTLTLTPTLTPTLTLTLTLTPTLTLTKLTGLLLVGAGSHDATVVSSGTMTTRFLPPPLPPILSAKAVYQIGDGLGRRAEPGPDPKAGPKHDRALALANGARRQSYAFLPLAPPRPPPPLSPAPSRTLAQAAQIAPPRQSPSSSALSPSSRYLRLPPRPPRAHQADPLLPPSTHSPAARRTLAQPARSLLAAGDAAARRGIQRGAAFTGANLRRADAARAATRRPPAGAVRSGAGDGGLARSLCGGGRRHAPAIAMEPIPSERGSTSRFLASRSRQQRWLEASAAESASRLRPTDASTLINAATVLSNCGAGHVGLRSVRATVAPSSSSTLLTPTPTPRRASQQRHGTVCARR